MPRLNEIIGSMDSQQQQRGLLLLQNVVKALASKRLRNDRRVFRVRFFFGIWSFCYLSKYVPNNTIFNL